ncbi:MAG: DUF362 domain-containing protein [Anaerolineae bacterium]
MKPILSRKEFIRRMALAGVGIAGASALQACGMPASPELNRITLEPSPTALPSMAPTISHTPEMASTPSPSPSPTTARPTATPAPSATAPYLAVVRGTAAEEITRQAVAALGGMGRFVKPGDDVIIKPNICNAYHGPEYASTTNPEVVAALVKMCLEAGARRVRVMDLPFAGTPQKSYETSGIGPAVQAAGGEMEIMSKVKYRQVNIPAGQTIKRWSIYGDALDADVLINVPIAKDHGSTRLTLGMKNLMGLVLDRAGFHARGLHQCIVDLNTVVRPHLTVVDATRILVANGPTGGSLDDVRVMNTVIASPDIVAADAYATTLFGLTPADVAYVTLGAERGLGTADLSRVAVAEISL